MASTNTTSVAPAQALAVAAGSALMAVSVAALTVAAWIMRRTWRRLFPLHWAWVTVAAAAGLLWLNLPWWGDALIVLAAPAVAWVPPAGGVEVRAYRVAVATTLTTTATLGPHLVSLRAVAITAAWSCLILGWPWWHHLRTWEPPVAMVEAEPKVDEDAILTAEWAERWQERVIDGGGKDRICAGTRVVAATRPRPHVVDLTLRLRAGSRIDEIARQAPRIDTALELDEGACGFRRTGKAALLHLTISERSYINEIVEYGGPVVQGGAVRAMVYADGSPMWWEIIDPQLGTLCGLVVGSTRSGKSRTLDVVIDGALALGIPVIIGDPQNGQSLPDWQDAVAEYRSGVSEVHDLIHRLHAEVMERSARLGAARVTVYRQDDPRVMALGITPLLVVIDECQLVLINGDKEQREIALKTKQIAETCGKTGVSLILATQAPQLSSLAGLQQLRDAITAFNCVSLRVSNNGAKATIFPADFVGDPMAIPKKTIDGITTAGMGYSKGGDRIGMLARTPYIDAEKAAAVAPQIPFTWLVGEDAEAPVGSMASGDDRSAEAIGSNVAEKLAAMFGVTIGGGRRKEGATDEWVVGTLTSAPQSAAALLSHTDCPVSKPQLYAVLKKLASDGVLVEPPRGGAWSLKP